jgi:FixJ family two-component response regulator
MSDAKPIVLVIDDDPELRESLARLFGSVGLDTRLFESITEFLKYSPPDSPSCLVLDVRLPERSGLDLQRQLVATNMQIPIIFITGHGDIPMSVQAMKLGAVEFLTKPFRHQDLVEAIHLALDRDRARRENDNSRRALMERFEALSGREREIMAWVTQGRLNKQIAGDMGISESTVKVHRSNVMRKMKARSLPELGRMADLLKLVPQKQNVP